MKKILSVALMSALCTFVQDVAGDEANKPVWVLDETTCESTSGLSKKIWCSGRESAPLIKPAKGGGFVASSPASRHLTLLPDHWLVVDLTSVKSLPHKYHAWSLYIPKPFDCKLIGNVTNPPTGLYTMQLPEIKEKTVSSVVLYNYNMELTFKYIKLVKEPENSLGIEFKGGKDNIEVGDTFKVVLKLAKPCEDVTCKILSDVGTGPNPYSINGKDNIELKAQDKDGKVWTATVNVKSLQTAANLKKRAIMLKATLLGSDLNKPIFTYIPYSFGPKPAPEPKVKTAK